MEEKVKLIECITSWQGEGVDTGKRMLILRFKNCDRVVNGNPCYFCDTLIKMKVSAEANYELKDIQKIINEEKCGILISGGEPLYGENYNSTLNILNKLDYKVANIETNGCNLTTFLGDLRANDKNVKIIYSPKIFNLSDLDAEKTRVDEFKYILDEDQDLVFIKVVAEEKNEFMMEFLLYLNSLGLSSITYLMPKGKSREELLKNAPIVFDLADKHKMNISSREHLIYDFI